MANTETFEVSFNSDTSDEESDSSTRQEDEGRAILQGHTDCDSVVSDQKHTVCPAVTSQQGDTSLSNGDTLSNTVCNHQGDTEYGAVISRQVDTKCNTATSPQGDRESTTVTSRQGGTESTIMTSRQFDTESTTVTSRQSDTESTTVTSHHSDTESTTVTSRHADTESTTVTSRQGDIKCDTVHIQQGDTACDTATDKRDTESMKASSSEEHREFENSLPNVAQSHVTSDLQSFVYGTSQSGKEFSAKPEIGGSGPFHEFCGSEIELSSEYSQSNHNVDREKRKTASREEISRCMSSEVSCSHTGSIVGVESRLSGEGQVLSSVSGGFVERGAVSGVGPAVYTADSHSQSGVGKIAYKKHSAMEGFEGATVAADTEHVTSRDLRQQSTDIQTKADSTLTDNYHNKTEPSSFTVEHSNSRRSLEKYHENKFSALDSREDSGLEGKPRSSRKAGEVKVLCEDDGSQAYEKTTTYIAGDRESTDDLIKRILAEARGEVVTPPRQASQRREPVYSIDEERSREQQASTVEKAEEERSSSRVERKLASIEQTTEPVPRSRYLQEEYEESLVRRPRHHADPYQDLYDLDSQGSSGYRPRHFRSNLMRKQQAILQDDWSDEDERTYKKEQQVEYIPDEEFIPQKAQDTDQVVQEKTEQIRDVVDKQSSVLQQLKSASDSFEEMAAEIKELKQHFLDNQIRRSMILDEIEHERMMMEQSEYESNPKGYQPKSQRARYGVEEAEEEEYNYRPVRPSQQRTVTLDKELEADTLGRGGLTGLAVGTSPLDTFRHKLSEKYQTALSGSAFTSSHSSDLSGKYQSLYDEEVSPRSRARYSLTRSYGALDDSEELESQEQVYRSPNLPSYRKYDYEKKDYSSPDCSTDHKPLYTGVTSRYSSLPRSKTLDYSTSTARSWQPTPEPAFSSRFLDKVREKKTTGEQVTRDKPFKSRFLGKSFDTESTFHRSSRTEDVSKYNGKSETASTDE